MMAGTASPEHEYIVVGSGAGGGTLASRLALAGHTVLLLEAGGDPATTPEPGDERVAEDYEVPVFHAMATENEAMRWDFFVRHYANDEQQKRDVKYCEYYGGSRVDGVLYPRAGTLGGCTAHNAMLTLYPHNADWDHIASLTGDASWKAANMRQYFERLEDCRYRPLRRWLKKLTGWNPTRHGFGGWLTTEKALPEAAFRDEGIVRLIKQAVHCAFEEIGQPLERLKWAAKSKLDANDWRLVLEDAFGIHHPALATRNHARNGTREFLLATARKHPESLQIELNALATRVEFDAQHRAIGVEYRKGRRLYRAAAGSSGEAGELRRARCSREVILCGGAFNTPQLLMLSGIGPRSELERHHIEVTEPLEGVGTNLQDRYEVGVVNRMRGDWNLLEGAKFSSADALYAEWKAKRTGPYITNGAVLALTKRSNGSQPLPDLCVFALTGLFRGYFPGYSQLFPAHLNYLTWAVLKAHTNNTAGEVRLRSADPRDMPLVNFRYFEEGNDTAQQDLECVVDGVNFARLLSKGIRDHIEEEELPGRHVETREDLKRFIRDNAWGHHASCSCPIGPRDNGGVLSSDFRVHGVAGLRVVDASVFPRIPGMFIAAPIYMVAEKAADVMISQANS